MSKGGGFGSGAWGGGAFGGGSFTSGAATLNETIAISEDLLVQESGIATPPYFFAAAQSNTKVMVTFSSAMNADANFLDPNSYAIRDFQGNAVAVSSVVGQGPTPFSRATLTLGANLTKGGYYVVEVNNSVVSLIGGLSVSPSKNVFQWKTQEALTTVGPLQIPLQSFSGEVTTGLLGQPAGQIFVSPALDLSVANSTIEIDEISLCSRAFDVYTFPQLLDPPALYTFGPTAPAGVLGVSTILWAPAERLGLARVNLTNYRQDTMPAAVDGPCDALLEEPIDITRAGFLSDARWHLYDGTATTFITADNLTPIGPGTPLSINLQP